MARSGRSCPPDRSDHRAQMRHQPHRPDENAAKVLLTELLYLVDHLKHDPGDPTVMEIIDKHPAVVNPKQKRRTQVRRDQLIRDYIEPRFDGSLKADKLKAEMLEHYYALLQTWKHNAVLGANHKNHKCEPLTNSSIRAIHRRLDRRRSALDCRTG